ncbi:MAG: preprotein translocase subunit YajC [Anaerotignum sp.]|nr:preprotein translocase subunit YajC [Anaerotignum sp.]
MADHPVMLIVIYCVVLLAIMYFLSIRPTQKKEKQLAELRNAIEIGDSIVTNSGFYGKVVDMTYDCLIVEFGLNRGVRIPVAKTEVFGKAEPNMSNEAPVVEEAPKKKGLFKRG